MKANSRYVIFILEKLRNLKTYKYRINLKITNGNNGIKFVAFHLAMLFYWSVDFRKAVYTKNAEFTKNETYSNAKFGSNISEWIQLCYVLESVLIIVFLDPKRGNFLNR